jgi:aquaporin Z
MNDGTYRDALAHHWPEYLMEAAELALFMISACAFGVLLYHPVSPVAQAVATQPLLQRALMGLAMGLSAIAIIFSPLGKQSGAHFNPSVTLTFLRLGKVAPWDAVFYVLFQFAGGIAGVVLAATLLRTSLAHPAVNYVATLPGPRGAGPAFLAEVVITFILMSVILRASNHKRFSRYTGLFAGALVATYITFESPISGMSMNPARTLGSAAVGHIFTGLWIYFTAPLLGMLLAAEFYVRGVGSAVLSRLLPRALWTAHATTARVFCAKLHHCNDRRCIFRCDFASLEKSNNPSRSDRDQTQPQEEIHAVSR